MRPLRVVYTLGELVSIADCGDAVTVGSEFATEEDSVEDGQVWVGSCIGMSSKLFPLDGVCILGIGRRCLRFLRSNPRGVDT